MTFHTRYLTWMVAGLIAVNCQIAFAQQTASRGVSAAKPVGPATRLPAREPVPTHQRPLNEQRAAAKPMPPVRITLPVTNEQPAKRLVPATPFRPQPKIKQAYAEQQRQRPVMAEVPVRQAQRLASQEILGNMDRFGKQRRAEAHAGDHAGDHAGGWRLKAEPRKPKHLLLPNASRSDSEALTGLRRAAEVKTFPNPTAVNQRRAAISHLRDIALEKGNAKLLERANELEQKLESWLETRGESRTKSAGR